MLIQNMDFKLKWYQQVFILLITCHSITLEAATVGFLPQGIQCACAGDRLSYNCSVVGGTATRWEGSLLADCPLDEITLRHSQFESNQAIETCNNGDISGYGVGVMNNCYTSQLSVAIRENFNNKTVRCILNSNEGTRTIGESVLSVISATNFYIPENPSLADAQEGNLVFEWSSVRSTDCNVLQYSITSDCGICPAITNTTIATCSDLQLSTIATMCHFRVSTRACNLSGNPSPPVAVTLKVPNIPQVKIIPSYSSGSQVLQKIFIVTTMDQTEDLFYISSGIIGSPVMYRAHILNLVSGISFHSTVGLSSCDEGRGCPVELLNNCPQSTIINVTISAANKLGEGPPSNPFMIECSNNFVQVVYKETSSESIISCIFLNLSDTSEKTCCITYRPCDHEGTDVQDCSDSFPSEIELELSGHSSKRYCYTVTASNDTHTAIVEGNFTLGDSHLSRGIIAVAIIVPFISTLVLLGVGILVAALLFIKIRSKLKPQSYINDYDTHPLDVKRYIVPYQLPSTLILHEVPRNFKLQEYITKILSLEFMRGHTYYEFTSLYKVENVLEGKEVLLQDKKNTNKWFRLAPPEKVAAGRLKLYGEGIARSSFGDQYRVFIQSFGSGARHLPNDSRILYNHSVDQMEPDALPLVPVCSEYFAHKVIDSEEGVSAKQLCAQNGLNTAAFNIFLNVEHLPEGMRDQQPRDVILMDRVSKELFTGPYAREMLDPKNRGESQNENAYEKWKVFALLERNKQGLVFNKDSELLYQDSNYQTGIFIVLNVDVDSVRLSKFIEVKLNCRYEDGKAFYEVTENDEATEIEEDLLYCKKILRPKRKELSCEELKLQSLIEYFYAIPGVPSKAVKPEQLRLEHHTIFLQSTSQGSRCLKKGTKILYLKEYIKLND